MIIKNWPIERVKPYDKNPRVNDGAVDAVAASLTEFGWRQPIVVDAAGVIIVGHTRWKAAQKLGMKKVPVHVATDMSDAQVKAYRLADNQTASLAEWDYELLPIEIADLQGMDFDLPVLGFSDAAIGAMADALRIPGGGEWGDALGKVPEGGSSGFQQMTFMLTDAQADRVKLALTEAKAAGPFEDTGNENSNGNAIARIAEAYRGNG